MKEPSVSAAPSRQLLGRLLPVLFLGAGLVLFFVLDLHRFLSYQALCDHRDWLIAQVAAHEVQAILAFVGLYTLVVAFSIPGAAALTIVAGFLFGTPTAAACAVIAATLGATALFLAARTALGDFLRARAGPRLQRMEAGFNDNALNYLLVLRLIPLFPFWLVNLVPAFLGVSLRTYVVGTFIGIIPGSLVYSSLGNGLGALIEACAAPDLGVIFEFEILLPILGLAVLALMPVAYKTFKARRGA